MSRLTEDCVTFRPRQLRRHVKRSHLGFLFGRPTVESPLADGWNRVIAMVSFRNAAVMVRDTFAFDRAGNLKTTAGAEVYDATTDRLMNRAGSGCTWSDTYDRAGNLTQAVCGGTTWSYGYTALNQLRTVKQNGTLIARYGYDVLGRRIAKRVYSAATGGTVAYTRFVYHGAHVAFETDSTGTIGLRYTWGIATDDLLAIRDSLGNHYYVVQDLLSSVRGLVKRDGTWMRSLQYGAYGAVLRDTASASAPTWELRYRWTGREYDSETGWYFFRSRSYDPAARRFVQEDAIGYAGSSNVYAYGDGAPLDGRDPSGLMMDAIAYNNPKWESLFRPQLPDVYIDGAFAGGGWLSFVMSMAQMNARYAEHVARTGRALLAAAGSGQHLSEDQKKALGNFCSLEPEVCSRAILTDDCGSISCWGAEALTWGGAINFQNGTNLGRTDQKFIASLAHELRHVVQWIDNPLGYDLSMIWTWSVGLLFNGNPYRLPGNWQDRSFSGFSREQQGAIVEYCYAGFTIYCSVSPYHP